MTDDVVVKVENVSKKFCRSLKHVMFYGAKDIARNSIGLSSKPEHLRQGEFWAVNNVSFTLKRGEAIGLIGPNGSGKSTLLKMLNGIFMPDRGQIAIKGRVGALIQVGAGFHPMLTGRENIYINGSIMGMSTKEINKQFDNILEFADIGDFIDAPVKHYSSGMHVRLGFAIAAHMNPDILLLDEVLAVGDAKFRTKCYNFIGKLRDKAALILVSHNMEQVAQTCDKCLFLLHGKQEFLGDVSTGIEQYLQNCKGQDTDTDAFEHVEPPVKAVHFEWDTLDISYGESFNLTINLDMLEDMPTSVIRIPFYDMQGIVVSEWHSKRLNKPINLSRGSNTLKIQLGPVYLKSGTYKFAFVLNNSTGIRLPLWSYKTYTLRIKGPVAGATVYQLPTSFDKFSNEKKL